MLAIEKEHYCKYPIILKEKIVDGLAHDFKNHTIGDIVYAFRAVFVHAKVHNCKPCDEAVTEFLMRFLFSAETINGIPQEDLLRAYTLVVKDRAEKVTTV